MKDIYQDLANAIIIQAARDWRLAVRKLKEKPGSAACGQLKTECEEFFRSVWLEELTSLDGEMILMKLKEEANDND